MNNHFRSILVTLVVVGLLVTGSIAFAAQIGGGASCTVDRDGNTFTITPPGCRYSGPADLRHGTGDFSNLELDANHSGFASVQMSPGGIFDGTVDEFDSVITIHVTGKDELEGYASTVTLSAHCEAHAGPWSPDDELISFETEMMRIEGELEEGNESDFAYMRVVAGTEYGYPSPGHTTASTQDGETYVVDSMFEIGFHIEYAGAPGGPLEGYEGSFEGTAVMKAFADPDLDPDAEAEAEAEAGDA